jgi:hypothetical protein
MTRRGYAVYLHTVSTNDPRLIAKENPLYLSVARKELNE